MGDKKEIHRLLKEKGFVMVRSKKHEVWKLGEQTVIVPMSRTIDMRLYKKILCDIKRGKTIRYGTN